MDKLAQKRSLRSKIWENVNLTGKALEGFHGEFATVMDAMRKVDEEIRNIAEDVKPLIRYAKSNLRQRDYLNAAHQITGFHSRVRTISHILDQFQKNIEIGHYDYFLNDFNGPAQEELFGYDPDAEIKEACAEFDNLIKEAGIYDWIKDKSLSTKDIVLDTTTNILTDKGRSRRLMEKRFNTSFVKKIKDLTIVLVSRSEKMLRDLLSIFDALETGVSRRNPKLYIAKAKEFVTKFKAYHTVYTHYRTEIIVPLKQHQDATNVKAKEKASKNEEEQKNKQQAEFNRQQAEEAAKNQQAYDDYNTKNVNMGEQYEQQVKEQNARSTVPQQPLDTSKIVFEDTDLNTPSKTYKEPSFDEWKEEKRKFFEQQQKQHGKEEMPFIKEEVPSTDPEFQDLMDRYKPKVKQLPPPLPFAPRIPPVVKKNHKQFIDQINVYANGNEVSSFVNELLDYSDKLEETDPIASAKLLTVANNIITDYKTAGIFDFLKGKPVATRPAEETEIEADTSTVDEPTIPEQRSGKPLRPGLQYLKQKPQELVEQQQNLMRPRKLDLPIGRIDKAYTDIGVLRTIGPEQIRITPSASKFIINMFMNRLAAAKDIDDLEPYAPYIEANLIPLLKQAIYNGWVIQSDNVMDEFNPRDKYLEIYVRLNLSDITASLSGIAKIHINCRISANNGTLTIRNITKHFKIENAKSSNSETFNEPEEVEDYGNHDDPNEQYDIE